MVAADGPALAAINDGNVATSLIADDDAEAATPIEPRQAGAYQRATIACRRGAGAAARQTDGHFNRAACARMANRKRGVDGLEARIAASMSATDVPVADVHVTASIAAVDECMAGEARTGSAIKSVGVGRIT